MWEGCTCWKNIIFYGKCLHNRSRSSIFAAALIGERVMRFTGDVIA